MKKPLLHKVNKEKDFTFRQDICRVSTDWIDNGFGIFKIALYIGCMFFLFFIFSSVLFYCIKLLSSTEIIVKMLPEASKTLTTQNIIDLSIKISTAGAGFGIIGTYYTIWNGFWSNYGELRKQLLANPFLYDLWYESDSGDYKVWVESLSTDERIIVLIFLESWADAYLAIEKWKMLLHNYSISFTEKAQLVAQELNLYERGGYGLRNGIKLGIIPENKLPPLERVKDSINKFITKPKDSICNKCREISKEQKEDKKSSNLVQQR
jgi:hypothetical protein